MEDKIEKNVDLNAPIERVWQALTDHREFGEWFRVALERPFVVNEKTEQQIRSIQIVLSEVTESLIRYYCLGYQIKDPQ